MAGPVETGQSLAGARSRPRSWCWCSFGVPRLVPRVVQSHRQGACWTCVYAPCVWSHWRSCLSNCCVCTALVITCVRVPCTKLDACETHPRTASPLGLPVSLFPQLFSPHVVLTSKCCRALFVFAWEDTHTSARTSVCVSVRRLGSSKKVQTPSETHTHQQDGHGDTSKPHLSSTEEL